MLKRNYIDKLVTEVIMEEENDHREWEDGEETGAEGCVHKRTIPVEWGMSKHASRLMPFPIKEEKVERVGHDEILL